jgi:hypothetical protein
MFALMMIKHLVSNYTKNDQTNVLNFEPCSVGVMVMGSPGIAAPLSDGSMLLKLGDKIMVVTTG